VHHALLSDVQHALHGRFRRTLFAIFRPVSIANSQSQSRSGSSPWAARIIKALQELERARTNVKKVSNPQVRGVDERAMLEATANAWFFSHRPAVLADADTSLLSAVDEHYKVILKGADRNTTMLVYLHAMTKAKAALIELKAHLVIVNVVADAAPDFSPLTKDAEMQALLERRWIECTKCVAVKAHLAGIVMMGGLLEALFVARVNQLADKSVLFKTGSVPMDSTIGKPLAWTSGC
jgi:hypothetical protein